MNLLEVIENSINRIREITEIKVFEIILELNNKKCNFEKFESKIGFRLSNEIKNIYLKYKNIKVVWEIKQKNERGYFEFVPFESLYLNHNELIEISKDFINDNSIEGIDSIIEDIRNWIPVTIFPNGDSFCIDKRNNKIVFYEHDVFDSGPNLHGLVIARNINELIEKWGEVLFIDIYDWYDGVDENGINLSKDAYKYIIELSK